MPVPPGRGIEGAGVSAARGSERDAGRGAGGALGGDVGAGVVAFQEPGSSSSAWATAACSSPVPASGDLPATPTPRSPCSGNGSGFDLKARAKFRTEGPACNAAGQSLQRTTSLFTVHSIS